MPAINLPHTDPDTTWVAIPISASSGSVRIANPLPDAVCYIRITLDGVVVWLYKCLANSTVTVDFPAGAIAQAAAAAPMTATLTVL